MSYSLIRVDTTLEKECLIEVVEKYKCRSRVRGKEESLYNPPSTGST